MKNIYCLVGPSGVGKTTMCDMLMGKHPEWKAVASYTDRPQRHPGESSHIFLTKEEFSELQTREELVAYTEFAGYRYGVTSDIVDNCDLYAIDPAGVEYMKRLYKGHKGIVVIGMLAPETVLFQRMVDRGSKEDDALDRILHDRKAFCNFMRMCDRYVDAAGGADRVCAAIEEIIELHETEGDER